MVATEEKINTLSIFEQSLHQIQSQKKSFQNALIETEESLKELSGESYKIIGNFMFKKNSDEIKKELLDKKELLNARIKSVSAQEQEIENQYKKLQEEVMKELAEQEKKGE